jgi:hypothetical protein
MVLLGLGFGSVHIDRHGWNCCTSLGCILLTTLWSNSSIMANICIYWPSLHTLHMLLSKRMERSSSWGNWIIMIIVSWQHPPVPKHHRNVHPSRLASRSALLDRLTSVHLGLVKRRFSWSLVPMLHSFQSQSSEAPEKIGPWQLTCMLWLLCWFWELTVQTDSEGFKADTNCSPSVLGWQLRPISHWCSQAVQ